MKTFIYGRPAVEGGDRGYRIFQSQQLENDELKQLKDCFSDDDPDVRRLQHAHFQPFFAWFPWLDGSWVFGKGRIEARGRLGAMYYSYLFHGCVLDETAKAAFKHNPFVLADFFDLSEERRSILPQIPEKINEKGLRLNLRNKAQALVAADETSRQAAGNLVAACLLHQKARIGFIHEGHFDANFWGVLYSLLPSAIRAKTSLASWAPFLNQLTQLRGLVEGSTTQPGGEVLLRNLQEKSAFTDLILRMGLAQSDETDLARQLDVYENAAEDLACHAKGELKALNTALENLFRAMERPSVHSLKLWPPAGPNGQRAKARHFLEIWRHNGREAEVFPDLADQLTQTLMADYQSLAPAEKPSQRELWVEFLTELGPKLKASSLRLLLTEPMLARIIAGTLEPERTVQVLLAREVETKGLALSLKTLRDTHPAFATIYEKACQQSWGRFLLACRRNDLTWIQKSLDLLTVYYEREPELFAKAALPLVFSRNLESAYPYLQALPFVVACLENWASRLGTEQTTEPDSLRWARLRLASCLKALYGPLDRWPARFAQTQTILRTNWLVSYYYSDNRGGRS